MKRIYFLLVIVISVVFIFSCDLSGSDNSDDESVEETEEEPETEETEEVTLETLQELIDELSNEPDIYMMQFKDGLLPSPEYQSCSDSCLAIAMPDYIAGLNDIIGAGWEHNNEIITLIKFDIAGCIPADAVIEKAVMTFCIYDYTSDDPVPATVHELKRDWNENTCTWNESDTGENWDDWDIPGNNYSSDIIASVSITEDKQSYDISLDTDIVTNWLVDYEHNYGIVIRSGPNPADMVESKFYFCSSDTTDVSDLPLRPMLTVFYSYPD